MVVSEGLFNLNSNNRPLTGCSDGYHLFSNVMVIILPLSLPGTMLSDPFNLPKISIMILYPYPIPCCDGL